MNEPAKKTRSRDPAANFVKKSINFFNNSMEKQRKSNSNFIHKISNLMETKYDLKRLLRTGTILALLFAWMLTGSFVANSQVKAPKATYDMILTIVGKGNVTVSGYANTIVGPVANSTVGPFADGSLLNITATASPGWVFTGWTGAVIGGATVTPNTILVSGANVPLTATFKKVLTLTTFTANNKVYNANTAATVTTWGTLVGVEAPFTGVSLNTGAYIATFDNKNVGTGKLVTITGLSLAGVDANVYTLASPITALANITAAGPLTVTGAAVTTKVYDATAAATITGATLNGVIGGDVVTLANATSGTFNNANVGNAKPVTVAMTLSGVDAGNYTLTQPAGLTGNITPKPITLNSVVVAPKVFDGTTTATITSFGAATGLIGSETTTLTTAGYVANFVNANVGNGKVVNITANVVANNTNYTIVLPFTATGNIIPPVYAMFTPSYVAVATRPTAPVNNVAINTPLSIEFNANVVDINGVPVISSLGDFVKLEIWNSGTAAWDLVPFSAARVGNKINITPTAGMLQYSQQYRLRFLNIYKPAADGGGQVAYTLDKDPVLGYDPTVVGALQLGNVVVFNTMSLATATLPTVTPFGAGKAVCGEAIRLTFINPVQYLNGTQVELNPQHKFTLQSSNDNVTFTDVPAANWTVTVNTPGNPTVFTFTTTPAMLEFNKFYRIRMNVGLDANYGFVDKVTGLTVMGAEFNSQHTQGIGWNWGTVATYPLIVDVAPWPISPVFPSTGAPLPFNVTVDAASVVTVGAGPAFTLSKTTAYTQNVTAAGFPVAAANGQGYSFVNWSRSTNGGTTYTTLPLTNVGIPTPVEGLNFAPATFNYVPNTLKPANCTESIAYRANFAINTYTVTASVTPLATGVVTGTGVRNHGATVVLTATPNAGQRFVSWDFSALPASVQATAVAVIPDANAIGYSGAPATLTFSLVGALTNNSTWNVSATFAAFEPKLYAATDPQNAFTGDINITKAFGSLPTIALGTEVPAFQAINYKWEQYAYNTSVKLEALGNDCRYVFQKWQRWDASLTTPAWVDFSIANPTTFFSVTGNMRVKAVYALKNNVNVSAMATNPLLGTTVVFSDPARTLPILVNSAAGMNFTFGTSLYITTYPEPDYYAWSWKDGVGATVPVTLNARFEDRAEWTYVVGCNSIDLKAVIDFKEYQVIVRNDLRTQGTVNASTPAFNASLGNQGGLGFTFSDVGAGRQGIGNFQRTKAVTFAATPAANFAFQKWEDVGGATVSTANPYTIASLDGAKNLKAVFVSTLPPPTTYALTINANPAQGTTTPLSGNYVAGASVNVVATALPGFTFVNWTAVGVTLGTPTNASQTITMPAAAVTLTANFIATQYALTPISRTYLRVGNPLTDWTIVGYGGDVAKNPATGTFTAGSTVQLTATPNPGFRFVNWMTGTIDGTGKILTGVQVSSAPQFNYIVPAVAGNAPMFVYAIFVEIAIPEYPIYTLATAAAPAGFGTVTGAGSYAHGVRVNVGQTATQPGYAFTNWSANVVLPDSYVQMDANKTATAFYAPITYQLNVYANNTNGTVSGSGAYTVLSLPMPVTATVAVPTCTQNFVFQGWFTDAAHTTPLRDAGGNIVTGTSFNFIPMALVAPATSYNVYAKFGAETRTYTVATATALGTHTVLNPAVGNATVNVAGPYTCNQALIISATANAGYEFKYWTNASGVLYIEQASFNHVVTDNVSFIAVYQLINYNVTATAQIGGTVNPTSLVRTMGQAVSVEATANAGYEFDGWVATGVTLANVMTNPAAFNMPAGNVTLLAKFKLINYNVTSTAQTGGTVAPAALVRTIGQAVSVTATANAGYTFAGWEATGVTIPAMTNPAAFNMPANNVTLLAKFTAIPYTVTLVANPTNGGSFTSVAASYTVGQSVTVTATPAGGFSFVNFTATGITLTTPTNATQTFTMPAGNVVLTGNFQASNNKLIGQVKYFNQFESTLPVSANLMVGLYNGATLISAQPVTVKQPGNFGGYYEFTGIVPATNYTVRVWEAGTTVGNTYTWNNWGGVTAADALVISYMIAGNTVVQNFPWIAPVAVPNYTPFAVKVADVNTSGTLTALDPLTVMYRSIGYPGTSPFPGGTPNFMVAGAEVSALGAKTHPQAPGVMFSLNGAYVAGTAAADLYYSGSVTGKSGETVFNIYYVATGDINASYVPQGGAKAAMSLNYSGQINAQVGEEIRIPVSLDQNAQLGAMNLGLSFNNNLIKVTGVEGYSVYSIDNANGTVRIAWMDRNAKIVNANDNIVVITAKVLASIESTTRLFELENNTEFVNANATTINGLSLSTVAVKAGNPTSINEAAALSFTTYPNPFNNETSIRYQLPVSGKVSVVVYNKLGQEVKTLVNENQVAGQHTVKLSSNDLSGMGTYFYKIKVEGNAKTYSANGTLILVK